MTTCLSHKPILKWGREKKKEKKTMLKNRTSHLFLYNYQINAQPNHDIILNHHQNILASFKMSGTSIWDLNEETYPNYIWGMYVGAENPEKRKDLKYFDCRIFFFDAALTITLCFIFSGLCILIQNLLLLREHYLIN